MGVKLIFELGDVIELEEGKVIHLGRGPRFRINDKRCSRKQVSIVAGKSYIFLRPNGINATCIYKKGPIPKKTKRNNMYCILNGESFTLILDLYRFYVKSDDPSIDDPLKIPSHEYQYYKNLLTSNIEEKTNDNNENTIMNNLLDEHDEIIEELDLFGSSIKSFNDDKSIKDNDKQEKNDNISIDISEKDLLWDSNEENDPLSNIDSLNKITFLKQTKRYTKKKFV